MLPEFAVPFESYSTALWGPITWKGPTVHRTSELFPCTGPQPKINKCKFKQTGNSC